MKKYKIDMIHKEALNEYHDLSGINESQNPELSREIKREIMNLIRNSDLTITDSLNCVKNTLMQLSFIAIDSVVNELENHELEKMREELK